MKTKSLKESNIRREKMRENWSKQNQYDKMIGLGMLSLDIQNYINYLEDIVCGLKENIIITKS